MSQEHDPTSADTQVSSGIHPEPAPFEPGYQPETTVDLPESSEEPEALAQDEPPQADTWGEQLQVRMGKLTGDIHSLNARLDRLEERNKAKD